MVYSAFHPFEFNKKKTKNNWNLRVKGTVSLKVALLPLKQMNFICGKVLLSIFLSIQFDFAYCNWSSVQIHIYFEVTTAKGYLMY